MEIFRMTLFLPGLPSSQDVLLTLAILAVFLNLFMVGFYIFAVGVERLIKDKEEMLGKKLQEIFSSMVSCYLFEESREDDFRYRLQRLATRPRYRKHLRKFLVNFSDNIEGATLGKLHDLYRSLGMEMDCVKGIRNWRSEIRIQSLRELVAMETPNAVICAAKLCRDDDKYVRMEALLALALLDPNNLHRHVEDMDEVSSWEEILILDRLNRLQPKEVPDFSGWLLTRNISVMRMGIKLLRHFNQYAFSQRLYPLITHPDASIASEAINTLGAFMDDEGIELMKKYFSGFSSEVKMEVIHAIDRGGSFADVPFLQEILGGNDVILSLEAGRVLNSFTRESVKGLPVQIQSPVDH